MAGDGRGQAEIGKHSQPRPQNEGDRTQHSLPVTTCLRSLDTGRELTLAREDSSLSTEINTAIV